MALGSMAFIEEHKTSPKHFTRVRVLTFRVICIMLLSKGLRSLQLSLNEIIPKLKLPSITVTAMAYSKARAKLRHTAFIALNDGAVVKSMYEDGDYKTLYGLRILAIDGSKILLPTTPETKKEFGTIRYHHALSGNKGEHSYALASVLYDALNHVALDARLLPVSTYEVSAAELHLGHTDESNLVIYDRNYDSYRMMARATITKGHFLIRCRSNIYKIVQDMFTGNGSDDRIVELTPNRKFTSNPQNNGLPQKLLVRFVRIKLNTGEYEVLATSLIDQEKYPTSIFGELYYCRWGIETFYGILKTRLNLENFSGLSPEAIRQDFHVAVLLTGIETIFTEDAETKLGRQVGGHPKKVNKAVSFNAIKQRVFELFMSNEPSEEVLAQLTSLFMTNPTLVRRNKKPKRGSKSTAACLSFLRRKRKITF